MIKKHVCFIFLLTCFLCFTASIYAQQKFVANLSGSQQVPANTSGGRGLCKLSLIQNETQIELACNYSNLSSASTAVPIGASVGCADWDVDGAADISVIRTENGQSIFYIRRSSDEQLQIIRWGAPSDLVKLGDYDGDGKTDAAVTRTINNQKVFLILQSSTGEPRYEYFGLPGDF